MMAAVIDETNRAFIIRPMRADDYPALRNLWTHCTGMGINNVDDTEDGITRFIVRNPTTCLVAVDRNDGEDGGSEDANDGNDAIHKHLPGRIQRSQPSQLLGAIMAGSDGRRAYVYHTAVIPAARGRGIGTALVRHMCDEFRALGIVKAKLVAIRTNEQGNAFWEHQGFYERPDLTYREYDLLPTHTVLT